MKKIGYRWTKILGTADRVEERIENLCYAGNFGEKIIGNSKKSENLPESEKEV